MTLSELVLLSLIIATLGQLGVPLIVVPTVAFILFCTWLWRYGR